MSVRLRTLSTWTCALAVASVVMTAATEAQVRRNRERNRADQYQDQGQNRNSNPTQAIDQRQPGTTSRLSNTNQNANANAVNQFFANCLATANKGEIEMNQWAQDRAQHPEVKQFAEQMVQDHQDLAQRLNQIANRQQTPQDSALSRVGEIERAIGQQCHQMVRAKLAEKPEGEFDECFLGAQIGAHIQMLAALDVISQQATGDLQQVAREAKPVVESHLQHAEELAQKLMNESMQASRSAPTQR